MEDNAKIVILPQLFCVYAHHILTQSAPVYIGMGRGDRAFETYCRSYKWKDLTKDGYIVSILGWFESKSDAAAEEKRLIQLERPTCNLVYLGLAGSPGNTWNTGRKHSKETKRKLSENQKISWQKTKRFTGTRRPRTPIKCIESGVVFESLKDAAEQMDLCQSGISQCILGIRKHVGGFTFIRLER